MLLFVTGEKGAGLGKSPGAGLLKKDAQLRERERNQRKKPSVEKESKEAIEWRRRG